MNEIILLLMAYLFGSIPSALIVGKLFCNIDIREHGSGNLGTTNTFRILGKKYGFLVFFMDFFKGTIILGLVFYGVIETAGFIDINVIFYGVAAVIGHAYPIFARFKGGKAAATTGGLVFILTPLVFIITISTFLITLKISKIVSIATTVGIIVSTIASFILLWPRPEMHIIFFTYVIIYIFILFKHRSNYIRLIKGNENKF